MATHHCRPTHYHNAIGAHEPVLRVAPGDTVVTTTVDARGGDADGPRVKRVGCQPIAPPPRAHAATPLLNSRATH